MPLSDVLVASPGKIRRYSMTRLPKRIKAAWADATTSRGAGHELRLLEVYIFGDDTMVMQYESRYDMRRIDPTFDYIRVEHRLCAVAPGATHWLSDLIMDTTNVAV